MVLLLCGNDGMAKKIQKELSETSKILIFVLNACNFKANLKKTLLDVFRKESSGACLKSYYNFLHVFWKQSVKTMSPEN